jgi:hypothetical protein
MVLATLAVLAVPMTTLAAVTGTTAVSGTVGSVPSTISVTPPSAVEFGAFVVGENHGVSATDGSVTVTQGNDSPSGWTCTAKDENTSTNSGHLLSPAPLNDALMISQDGSTYVSAATGSGLTYNSTGFTTGPLPFRTQQNIVTRDVTGTYTINILFTAAITP